MNDDANAASPRTLYSTGPPRRFYLVPDDADLPSGELVLTSLTKQRLLVDPEAVQGFEVSADRAREIAEKTARAVARKAEELAGGAQEVRDKIAAAGRKWRAARQEGAPREEVEAAVADAIGVDLEMLRSRQSEALDGLRALISELGQKLRVMLSDDPADRATTQAAMQTVAAFLRARGKEGAAAAAADLPDNLRSVLSDPRLEQAIRDASDGLKRATAESRARRQRVRKS